MHNISSSFYIVRFGDCDPFGHLNNARYVDYFINAREDHLRDDYQMDLSSWYAKGLGWVVQQHEIRYLKPAVFNEKVCVRSALLLATPDQLLVEMLMLDEKCTKLKALMHTTFTPVNTRTGKKEIHTEDFMDFIRDKILPVNQPGLLTVKDRIASWQVQLNSQVTI